MPQEILEQVFAVGFECGKELGRLCDVLEIPAAKAGALGFGASGQERKSDATWTVAIPQPCGNPSTTSNLSTVLYQSLASMSVRLIFANAAFHEQETAALTRLARAILRPVFLQSLRMGQHERHQIQVANLS